MSENTIAMIERHEGLRATVYCDACSEPLRVADLPGTWFCGCWPTGRGNLTVGYGQRIDGDGISPAQAETMLFIKLNELGGQLMLNPWYVALDGARQSAICDMAYTLGVNALLKFERMISALVRKDWAIASREILASKWALQAPERAAEIAQILLSGVMP